MSKIILAAALAVALAAAVMPTAHADDGQLRRTCERMDDPAGRESGYTPVTYAVMLLRFDSAAAPGVPLLSEHDALQIVSDAAHKYCPQHLADLPAGWR